MGSLLINRFKSSLKDLQVDGSQPILVAVSGGLDSMVLAELCRIEGLSFEIAHVNYGLRGIESDKDTALVEAYAKQHAIHVNLKKVHLKKSDAKDGIQDAAREIRYTWFNEVMEERGLKWIFTAHHLGDRIETWLINAVRGAGLSGLSSIPEKNGKILRPLLNVSRNELEEFANENALQWREDASNQSMDYLRNRIRHRVMSPLLESDSRAEKNIASSIDYIDEARIYFEREARDFLKFYPKTGIFEIPESEWRELFQKKPLHKFVFEALGFGSNLLKDLEFLTDSQSGKKIIGNNFTVYRDREKMVFAPIENQESAEVIIEEKAGSINGDISMKWRTISPDEIEFSKDSRIAVLDLDKLSFPLRVRKWQASDKFKPFGMEGTKKLSDFLIDLKLSVPEKNQVHVMLSGKSICWVIGLRIDERFRVKPTSKKAIIFEIQ